MPSIVNVGYKSTNFWVISTGRARFLVDLGWPGTVTTLLAQMQRMDIPMREVTHGFATHYHPDHAGAAQDLKQRGMQLVVTPEQVPYITQMARWMKPADRYTPIATHDNRVIPLAESRDFLAGLGLDGEFVHTPGHSDDSVSLVLDSGIAFTGDLTLPFMVGPEDAAVVARSWQALRDRGVHTIHAGHAAPYPIPPAA